MASGTMKMKEDCKVVHVLENGLWLTGKQDCC